MEKFNLTKEKARLAEILSTKPATGVLTKEDYKKSVVSNLPFKDNEDTRDFMQSLGITDKHPAEKYQDRIELSVKNHTLNKNKSMQESAIIRDATLMAVAEYGDPKNKLSLTYLHAKWIEYYKPLYEEAYR